MKEETAHNRVELLFETVKEIDLPQIVLQITYTGFLPLLPPLLQEP